MPRWSWARQESSVIGDGLERSNEVPSVRAVGEMQMTGRGESNFYSLKIRDRRVKLLHTYPNEKLSRTLLNTRNNGKRPGIGPVS